MAVAFSAEVQDPVNESRDPLAGKRLVIVGLARQGVALARFAASVGAHVLVTDLRSAEALASALIDLVDVKMDLVLGEHSDNLLDGADVLAISGGVPADAPLVQSARRRGIPVTNDSLEFLRRTPSAVIGVTGSAGKTTTTALTGAIGQESGRRTWIGGNIGYPLISHLAEIEAGDVVVQELSSFQLEIWDQSPPVAAVLNITPNHLDRHKTMAVYRSAKANILRHQKADGIALLSADDPMSLSLRGEAPGRVRLFSLKQPVADGAYCAAGQIWLRDANSPPKAVCDVGTIRLRGTHNVSNVLAAVALADSVGIPASAMRTAIANFEGVEHRLESVATIAGVQYINDSIATAPERAIAAIQSFADPVVLLAGGRDKDLDWAEWVQVVSRDVKAVLLFGELAPMLEALLEEARPGKAIPGGPLIQSIASLELAVPLAAELASPGDVVLLSPGGTSFDAYNDFAARGRAFRAMVLSLAGKSQRVSVERNEFLTRDNV